MKYTRVISPQWANAERTAINCGVDFDDLQEEFVPFTAHPNDPYNASSKEIFDACVAGEYGQIAEYVASSVPEYMSPPAPTKAELLAKLQAIQTQIESME